MNTEARQFIDSLADRPPRSALEPHLDFIRELRRKRCPFTEVARILAEKCDLKRAPSTIHNFLKVRRRRPKPTAEPTVGVSAPVAVAPKPQVAEPGTRRRFEFSAGEVLRITPKQEQP